MGRRSDGMKYILHITFLQTISREVEANSEEEAKIKGTEIAQDLAEQKVINIDVIVQNDSMFCLDKD